MSVPADDYQDQPMSMNSPDNKKKQKEDWNYLKQTLRSHKGMN
jgi:hypothetical protein